MLSIIMAVYNGEKTLARAVDSILNQTFKDFELIIVNDGSTDNTEKILDKYASGDKRIKIINQKNLGQGEARNAALDIAAGDYIGFVDADDEIVPDMYNTMLKSAKDADICQCAITDISPNGNKGVRFKICETLNICNRHIFLRDYLIKSKFGFECCNKIYSRAFLVRNNVKFASNEKVYSEDLYFNVRCALYAEKIIFIDKPLYIYYHSNKSHSKSKDENTAIKMLNIFDEVYTEEYRGEISSLAVLVLFVTASASPECTHKLVNSGNMRKYIKYAVKFDNRIYYKLILMCMLYAPPFVKTLITDLYFGQKLAKLKTRKNEDNRIE